MQPDGSMRTPLADEHQKLAAVMTDFSGWYLPVYYTTIIQEHLHTRKAASIFDISHMGEIEVKGREAVSFLQYVMTNDLSRLPPYTCFYSAMCYEHGGSVDDCFVYQFSPDRFWVIVNAANIKKDTAWLKKHSGKYDVFIDDLSSEIAKIDLQGPLSQEILQKLTDYPLSSIKRFSIFQAEIAGFSCTISRSGYTGEDGFEIYFSNKDAVPLWQAFLSCDERVKPAGLGARDTLRTEACYSLYGHELSDSISPVEAGIGWVVRDKTEEYLGKEILLKQKREGTPRSLIALQMLDKGIPRSGYEIYLEGKVGGFVSSGCYSPTFSKSIALGFVPSQKAQAHTLLEIKIRDKFYQAQIVQKPFYHYKGV
jgi:aminomethyltransferase